MCLWTSETQENGQKRCGSDEKVQKLDPSWKRKSRRQSSGVMHPEEEKNESEKETNPPFIFRITHISKKKM